MAKPLQPQQSSSSRDMGKTKVEFRTTRKIGKRAAPEESGTVSSIRDFARKDSRRWQVRKGVCSNRSEKFFLLRKITDMKMERKGRAASVLKGFVEAAKVVDQRRSDIVSVVRFNREWVRPGSFGGTFANAWYRFWRAERLWQADASVRKAGNSNRNVYMDSKWLILPCLLL